MLLLACYPPSLPSIGFVGWRSASVIGRLNFSGHLTVLMPIRLIMLLIFGDSMKAIWLFMLGVVSIERGTIVTESAFCQSSGFLVHFGTEISGEQFCVFFQVVTDKFRRLCGARDCNTQRASGVRTRHDHSLRWPLFVSLPSLYWRGCFSCHNGWSCFSQFSVGLHVPGSFLLSSLETILVSFGTTMDPEIPHRRHHSWSCNCHLCTRGIRISRLVQFCQRNKAIGLNDHSDDVRGQPGR